MEGEDARRAREEKRDDTGDGAGSSKEEGEIAVAEQDDSGVARREETATGDDVERGADNSIADGDSEGGKKKPKKSRKKASPQGKKIVLPTLDAWLSNQRHSGGAEAPSAHEVDFSSAPSHEENGSGGVTPVTTPSPKKRKRKQQAPSAAIADKPPVSLDDVALSVDALRDIAAQRGLDVSSLASWQCTTDGRLMDPEQHSFKTVREALRVLSHSQTGRIPREDIYFLAVLRRKVAEASLPFQDGPISVLALGRVFPKELFFSQKKLFPVGFETVASVSLVKAGDAKIRLNCKIAEGNNQKSPIFVVSAARDPDVMFRSYVASKAWKKAIGHFEALNEDERAQYVDDPEAVDSEHLVSSGGEDGFGLLRRNITRILEGGHQVLQCAEYQFWEERHPISPEAHAKLRSRLMKQWKELLRQEEATKDEIRRVTSQEVVLADHQKSPEQLHKDQQRKERERREAEKLSVREAARKLLEIEMKAQEDAKEAQRKEREDRKNALLEAKMEIMRQKEARKDAARREKEEERRMREEEKDMRKFLKEEEKRRKVEEKEMHMQRKIDELRERRKMREQQRSILENGVQTTGPGGMVSGHGRSLMSPLKGGRDSSEVSAEKQRAALLKFVREERERRRRLRVWERRRLIEKSVWSRVKSEYTRHEGIQAGDLMFDQLGDVPSKGVSFPGDAFTKVAAFDELPVELHVDAVFAWDTISTFSDVLQAPFVPPLNKFVELLVNATNRTAEKGVEPTIEDAGAVADRALAAITISMLKVLLAEFFPALQMGTTLDEFVRTRPLNFHTWPEIARHVCLLALEMTHPSVDDQTVKSLKGSRSNRDDPMLLPIRQRLQDRGAKLLAGQAFEEGDSIQDVRSSIKEKPDQSDSSSTLPPPSSTHYGVVADAGVSSMFRVRKQGNYVVVEEMLFKKRDELASTTDGISGNGEPDADVEKIQVGDYIIAVNGLPVTSMLETEGCEAFFASIPAPHGLLMSSTPPTAKPVLKHIPTTLSANKLKRCAHVLKILRSKEIAGPFNQPVETELYPDYYTAVSEPMDLGTIQEKIEDEEYENDDDVEAFVDDVNLVWKNCYTFNSMKAEISLMAKKLSAIFDRLMEEWVETKVMRPLISVEEDHCRMCRTNQVRDRLLLCDRCDASYHTFCLSPPLKKVPTGEWYCPRCAADPTFTPDLLKKKSSDGERDGGQHVEVIEYTDVEKKLLQALDYLSKEDPGDLALAERVSIFRVLSELLLNTSIVQDVYRSLEEKANDVRKECGDSLMDLLLEWEGFAPPKSFSGIDRTARFIIDGVEHELSDDLLDYLEKKTIAERNGEPIPELPAKSGLQSHQDLQENDEDSEPESSASEDEIQLLEDLGDIYLACSTSGHSPEAVRPAACEYCGLEDGIVNGPLRICKQSPLSKMITDIEEFEVPSILARSRESVEVEQTGHHRLLEVHVVGAPELANVVLHKVPHGVRYVHPGDGDHAHERLIYCVNDCLVHEMSRDEVAQVMRASKPPIRIYTFTGTSHEALRACVSVVSFPTMLGVSVGVELTIGHEGFVFVRSLQKGGLAELSDQVFPGDVLLMVDGEETQGRTADEVVALLQPHPDEVNKSVVLVHAPSTHVKKLASLKSWSGGVLVAQRAKLSNLLTQVVTSPKQRTHREHFDVTFQHGPLGLALSLENRVVVKSLNDNADGTPGQASLCGLIRAGDVIERINGTDYGVLRDLSQFTASLVTLPRPIVISFSREVVTNDDGFNESDALDLFGKGESLRRKLGLRSGASATVKTLYIARDNIADLPFTVFDFAIQRPKIVKVSSPISCSSIELGDTALEVGDRLVGVNGCSTSGLSWDAISRVLCQIRGPVYLHFEDCPRFRTQFHAHESCVYQANVAWSEAEFLYPKIQKAKRIEALIKHIVPRSELLGKCGNLYEYFRFYGDRHRLFAKASDGLWLVATSSEVTLGKIMEYLESTGFTRLANRIRSAFPRMVGEYGDASLTLQPHLQNGPFAVTTEISAATDNGDSEKFDAHISYLGRRYFIGSFGSRQDADAALKRSEHYVGQCGTHVPPLGLNDPVVEQLVPSISVPTVKAEAAVRRVFQRRYEYGNVVDAHGQPIRVPLSQAVICVLRRGMQGGGSQLGYGSSGHGGQQRMNNLPAGGTVMQGDSYKRKAPEAISSDAMRYRIEAQKRARPQSVQHQAVPNQAYPTSRTSSSDVARRHLQPLADQGRAMLTAWNNYANASTPQATQGLAFACVTSFEEVKKATTRLMSDPSLPNPDVKTFVCLHHAYVVGLMCAMTTQALTNSHRTNGDSMMVKVIADGFATALLCCIDPSPLLRNRAMGGFASVVKQCDRAMRPRDLSEPLHHVANFIVQFVQVSRYLAVGSFDDLTQCRPVIAEDQRAMEMLPASFVQQIRLLENVRRAFVSRASGGGVQAVRPPIVSPGSRPSSASHAFATSVPINHGSASEQLFHVDFGPGPLGIMINYSARGKVVVTEYSGDRGQMGQAQASGKIAVGDEVFAINGRLVESIGGMEGFKAVIASGQRPIRVTFKKTPESLPLPNRSGSIPPRRQTPPQVPGFGYAASNPNPMQQSLEPIPLPPTNGPQQMMYRGCGSLGGGIPPVMPRPMYQHQPPTQGMMSAQGFAPSGYPPANGAPMGGYDSLPSMYDSSSMPGTIAGAGGNWNPQSLPIPSFNPQPLMPAPLDARSENGRSNPLGTPPQFSRSSASMGFPSPPDLNSTSSRPPPVPMQMSMPTPYGGSFVAPNDPSLHGNDTNNISYFDANGTTFRSTPDFEIDTTVTSAPSIIEDETSTVEGDGNDSILDMDTEEERDEPVDTNSGSVSQMTTPANSDVESEPDDSRLQSSRPAGVPVQPTVPEATTSVPEANANQTSSKPKRSSESTIVADGDEDMSMSMARRSARVPRKITTNIADMYNPDLNGSARGRGGGGVSDRNEVFEPTHGEVGELATELLEEFATTIRSIKGDVPATLQLLRAQLLAIEAAIPRDAFRPGKWTRSIRAAWGEMVFSCDKAAALMEATFFLESNLESDWLEPWWKSSFLPTARYAFSSATIASAAMRVHALDDAITYVRVKRGGGKRKAPQRSGASSEQSSPVKSAMIDLTTPSTTATHPIELPFMAKLEPGTVSVATMVVDRILAMQRDKIQITFAHRQAIRELIALTDLTEDQIDQWIRAAAYHTQQLQQAARSQQLAVAPATVNSSGGMGSGSSTRQATPKRKLGGAPAAPVSDQRPNRKRKVAPSQQASLPCFQMQTASVPYRIPSTGRNSDPTVRARLELILSTLLKNELAIPFAAPVNVRDVPGYTDIIEQPMDLGTIRSRLSRGFYDNRFELVAQDVNLVWTNCFHYNRIDSEISKSANRLRSIFNRLFEHWISEQPPGTPVSALPSEEPCRQCVQTHSSDRMLLCDSCDAAYHLFCLTPPLAEIPSGDWFCPRCPIQQLTL